MGKVKKGPKTGKVPVKKVGSDQKIEKKKLKKKGGKFEKAISEEVKLFLKNGTAPETEIVTPIKKKNIKSGKKNVQTKPGAPNSPTKKKGKAKGKKKFAAKNEEQPKVTTEGKTEEPESEDEEASVPETMVEQKNKTALKKTGKAEKSVGAETEEGTGEAKSYHFDPEAAKKTIFVGNLPTNTKKMQLIKLFAKAGQVKTVRFRSADGRLLYATKSRKKCPSLNAYVVFAEDTSVHKAIEMSGIEFKGQHLRITTTENSSESNDSKKTVFIGNLKYSCTEEQLHGIFSSCGEIEYVRAIQSDKGCKGVAYICFKKPESVGLALELNSTLVDDRPIRVERYSKSKLGAHEKRKDEEQELTGPAKRIADKQNKLEKGGKKLPKGNKKNKKDGKTAKKSEFRGVQVDNKKKFKKKKPNQMKQLAKKIAPKN